MRLVEGGTPMATQTLTLKVPDPLYARIRHRAEKANRTVEAELLDVLAAAVSGDGDLPPDLAEAIAALALLDDAALWQAARSGLDLTASSRMEELHRQRQSAGLTDGEESELRELVRRYERAMLVRARAAALLRQRGHDVSGLTAP